RLQCCPRPVEVQSGYAGMKMLIQQVPEPIDLFVAVIPPSNCQHGLGRCGLKLRDSGAGSHGLLLLAEAVGAADRFTGHVADVVLGAVAATVERYRAGVALDGWYPPER